MKSYIYDTLGEIEETIKHQNLLDTIINSVPLRVYWKDTASRFLGANRLFLQDAQCENTEDIIGKSDFDLPWTQEDSKHYRDEDKKIFKSGIAKLDREECYTDKEGMKRWVSISLIPLKNKKGDVLGLVGTYYDISEKKEHENNLKLHRDALEYQATHDALTTLPNRILFLDRLEHALYLAKRNQGKVAVLFIDMDRFKDINDSLGHVFGDLVIKEVAKRLKNQIRTIDTVARFGGDEFVVCIDTISHTEIMTDILEKLIKSLDEPILINEYSLHIGVSIGVSLYPYDAQTPTDLLKNADTAMYKAKSMGGNTYQFYTEDMTHKALKRMELTQNLRKAIENEAFVLYYQPQFQVNMSEDKIIIGMEALIRWEIEDDYFISPDIFIPLAEDTGLIVPLGRWITKEGMRQMAQWYNKGFNPGVLSLNFSILQLQESDFIAQLQMLLEHTGCKPQWIAVEITETQMMKNPETTISTLKALHQMGIKISIDDFGTGYSSLSYLKHLPIDTLKIDKSFIDNLPEDEEDLAISKSILALAASLNLSVIAEGVERVEQKNILVENGCRFIQGYYTAKPMPADEVEQFFIS